jgi:hypothetical protein
VTAATAAAATTTGDIHIQQQQQQQQQKPQGVSLVEGLAQSRVAKASHARRRGEAVKEKHVIAANLDIDDLECQEQVVAATDNAELVRKMTEETLPFRSKLSALCGGLESAGSRPSRKVVFERLVDILRDMSSQWTACTQRGPAASSSSPSPSVAATACMLAHLDAINSTIREFECQSESGTNQAVLVLAYAIHKLATLVPHEMATHMRAYIYRASLLTIPDCQAFFPSVSLEYVAGRHAEQ